MKRKILLSILIINILCGGCGQVTEPASPEGASLEQAAGSPETDLPTDPPAGAADATADDIPDDIPDDTSADSPDGITLLMVGDILLHTPVEESAKQADGSYDFHAVFAHTKELIREADLALVNQEVILGGEELGISGYPAFNAPYEVGDTLAETGFDVICHATNHALDKGKRGILNCTSYWQENHPDISVLGIHDTEPALNNPSLYLYTKNDISVAILNYTYGTNGIPLPEDMPYAVDLLEKEKVIADIQLAEELADFTIVCPHWGTEYRLTPDAMQAKWTQIFLENGVDLVLGTHPHVIEPIVWVEEDAPSEEADSNHQMLVYYSLGNFVNWTSGTGNGVANRMVGGMARLRLERDDNDNVVISDYGIKALVCHVEPGTDGVTVYPLSEYTEELSGQNAIRSQDPDFSKEYCVELCDQVWGELWD